jgi:hypothetical protein
MTAAATEVQGCTGGSVRTGRRRELRKLHGGRLRQSLFFVDLQLQGLRRAVEDLQFSRSESNGGCANPPFDGATTWTRAQLLLARSSPEASTKAHVFFSLQPRTQVQDSPQPVPSLSNECCGPTLVGEVPLRGGLVEHTAQASVEAVRTALLKPNAPQEHAACLLAPAGLDIKEADCKGPYVGALVSSETLDASYAGCPSPLCASCNRITKETGTTKLCQLFGCSKHGWCAQPGTLDDSTFFWTRPSTGRSTTQRELLEQAVDWVVQLDSGEVRAATAGEEARLRTAVAGILAMANAHLLTRGLPPASLSAWQAAKENFEDLFGSLNLTYLYPAPDSSDEELPALCSASSPYRGVWD